MPNRIAIETVKVIIQEVMQQELHLNASDPVTIALLQRIENRLMAALAESQRPQPPP
jgi:hypothetical protein